MGKWYKYCPPKCLLFLILTAFGVAAGAAEDDFGLFVYPNPFVAGYDEGQLAYELPDDAVISVNIYDLDGNRVRTLADRVDRSRGSYRGQDRWDGCDDGGQLVRAGPYLVVLDVRMRGETFRDTFTAIVNR